MRILHCLIAFSTSTAFVLLDESILYTLVIEEETGVEGEGEKEEEEEEEDDDDDDEGKDEEVGMRGEGCD